MRYATPDAARPSSLTCCLSRPPTRSARQVEAFAARQSFTLELFDKRFDVAERDAKIELVCVSAGVCRHLHTGRLGRVDPGTASSSRRAIAGMQQRITASGWDLDRLPTHRARNRPSQGPTGLGPPRTYPRAMSVDPSNPNLKVMFVRAPRDLVARLDRWRGTQPDVPS